MTNFPPTTGLKVLILAVAVVSLPLTLRGAGEAQDGPPAKHAPGFPQYADTPGADPSITHDVDILVPTRLIITRTRTHLSVAVDGSSLRQIHVAAGKNMSLGMKNETWVYPVGSPRPLQPDSLGYSGGVAESASLNIQAIGNSKIYMRSSEDGIPKAGTKYVVEEIVAIFQTASPPQHMWRPEGAKYQVLWQTTLREVSK